MPELLIVEGAGCGARLIAERAVLLVWVEAPRDVRFRRGMVRDGETYRPHWERWARQEKAHFAAELTACRAAPVQCGRAGRTSARTARRIHPTTQPGSCSCSPDEGFGR